MVEGEACERIIETNYLFYKIQPKIGIFKPEKFTPIYSLFHHFCRFFAKRKCT